MNPTPHPLDLVALGANVGDGVVGGGALRGEEVMMRLEGSGFRVERFG
jgi:hypothetical protein